MIANLIAASPLPVQGEKTLDLYYNEGSRKSPTCAGGNTVETIDLYLAGKSPTCAEGKPYNRRNYTKRQAICLTHYSPYSIPFLYIKQIWKTMRYYGD